MATEDTNYALGRSDDEYSRLIEQAASLRPLTERVLRAAGITEGMRVLDIGCGVGDVSFLVSELVGSAGSVVSVDLDSGALAHAERRRAALGIGNVAFHLGDARSINAGELFDAAVGRFVLMYMRDPTEALRQIAEKVRPGGTVVFHEWLSRESTTASSVGQPVLATLQRLLGETFERSGASQEIGAELFSRMQAAGLEPDPRPLAEYAYDLSEDTYRRWALIGLSVLPRMVEYGLTSGAEGAHMIRHELRDELVGRDVFVPVSPLMIGQWARKPAT